MTPEARERAFLIYVQLFKNIGYGRMQQIISHEWYRHDPIGAALANTCYGLLDPPERQAYEDLAKNDPLFSED